MARRGISGAAENPDLESRLLKIENKVKNLGSYSQSPTTDSAPPVESGTDQTPGLVFGVSVTATVPGAITLRWVGLVSNNINHYDVWVSTDKSFVDPIATHQYKVSNKTNVFTFAEPDDGTLDPPYYLKVRGVSTSGRTGPWSAVVDSQTGKATASHFGFGTDVLEDSHSWENPEILESTWAYRGTPETKFPGGTYPAIKTVGSVTVEVTEPTALLCIGLLDLQYELIEGSRVTIGFTAHSTYAPPSEADVEFGVLVRKVALTAPLVGVYPFYFVDVFDPPSIGTYTFHIKVKLDWNEVPIPVHGLGSIGAPGNPSLEELSRRIAILRYKLTIAKLI